MVARWLDEAGRSGVPELLVMASDSYTDIAREAARQLGDNAHILLLESPHTGMPEGVSTLRIGRFGAACLAGMMAAESQDALIVAANESDPLLRDAVDGFKQGYTSRSGGELRIAYLADDEAGYDMPGEAYSLMEGLEETFIFPLAGGSNSGIYKFTRENMFSLLLVAGMDVDCSEFSTRVPFSLTVNLDNILRQLLSDWIESGRLPAHMEYNMGNSDCIGITLNPHFLERAEIFLDYYADADYWQRRHDSMRDDALTLEQKYYAATE